MMRLQPSEGLALSWQDYQGVLWTYSDRQNPEGANDEADAPDAGLVERSMLAAEKAGLVRTLH